MNNKYILPKNSIKEIFDDIAIFLEKVDNFKQYQPDYNYDYLIQESSIEDFKWELVLNVWYDESKEKETPEEVKNPFGVL